jgi:hypothetical protein
MERPPEYEKLSSGKQIVRMFDAAGAIVSEQQTYGVLDIGLAYMFSGGAKIQETYFSNKRMVGRRAYEKARANYPDMPEADADVEDWGTDLLRAVARESRERNLESKRHQPNPDEARDKDNFCEERMREGETQDATKWIRTKGHTLGERDWRSSKRLVARLALAGSIKIWACEIESYEDGTENTGHLVVKLPKEKASRTKVFKIIDRLARETGYHGPFDDGEKYAYVKLD